MKNMIKAVAILSDICQPVSSMNHARTKTAKKKSAISPLIPPEKYKVRNPEKTTAYELNMKNL
jgi:hypothetical protein